MSRVSVAAVGWRCEDGGDGVARNFVYLGFILRGIGLAGYQTDAFIPTTNTSWLELRQQSQLPHNKLTSHRNI